jgi:spore coat polysaccharide biosynthesis protein SpsF
LFWTEVIQHGIGEDGVTDGIVEVIRSAGSREVYTCVLSFSNGRTMRTEECAPIRVFVQARMSSRRFPGKVLASLAGRPMLAHVLERCAQAFGADRVVLATSREPSDDAVAQCAEQLGYRAFRGDLDNVVSRFQQCLAAYPCDWFVRISADSPMIDPQLIVHVANRRAPRLDLVTNVRPRTFPSGQSVEVVRSDSLAHIDAGALSAEEREHLTQVYYRNPARFKVLNVASRDAALARQHLTVDTPEDLRAAEAIFASGHIPGFAHAVANEECEK